jgi:glycosyltransferase involved in cell wall biosynthesis
VAELGLGGAVRFTGHVAQPQALYAGFDVFALSSDTEQMPLSVLEAMAARLPVAATDVGDVRGMLAETNGRFVVPRDDGALADALLALLRDPARRRAIGADNRAKAERDYDQATMFAAWAALFDGRGAGA